MTLSLTPPPAPQREVLEAGPYDARIVQIIDLGMQPGNEKFGKPPHQKIQVTYELVGEFMKEDDGTPDEERPRWISESFNFYGRAVEKSPCGARFRSLDPEGKIKDDNIFELIDTPCVVTVVHNPKPDGSGVWENIGGVAPMRAKNAEKLAPLVNPPVLFSTAQPDVEVFGKLPDFVKKKILGAVDFKGSPLDVLLGGVAAPVQKDVPIAEEIDDEVPY